MQIRYPAYATKYERSQLKGDIYLGVNKYSGGVGDYTILVK
ncbi:hypothetical protein [Bacillus mycoides]|nr:hypothetical protein [Bacillus mycoides]